MQILYCMQIFPQIVATYQNVSFGHGTDIHKHLFLSVAEQLQKFSGGIVSQKSCLPFATCGTRNYICLCFFSEVCNIFNLIFWGLQYHVPNQLQGITAYLMLQF